MLGLRCELADRHASIMRRRSGQTLCGTLPAPSLPPCEIHVQMRPRPYSRAIGRSAFCEQSPPSRSSREGMRMPLLYNDPEHWRERAVEARALAHSLAHARVRSTVLLM
jgi:hypothetical protein